MKLAATLLLAAALLTACSTPAAKPAKAENSRLAAINNELALLESRTARAQARLSADSTAQERTQALQMITGFTARKARLEKEKAELEGQKEQNQ